MSEKNRSGRGSRSALLLSLVLAVIAAALIVGGVWLVTLGGSVYYVVAGLATATTAWLVFTGCDGRAMATYLGLLALTAVWSVWECGLNVWGLQARLFAPVVLGYWICFPALRPILRVGLPTVALLAVGAVSLPQGFAAPDDPSAPRTPSGGKAGEWRHYGQDLAGTRFSRLSQLTPANVGNLKQAWVYHTGATKGMGFEATPLMVDDTLYLCSPNSVILALDPDTGARRWQFDPKIDSPPAPACRGVAFFEATADTAPCAKRIIFGTADARLMAVDSRTGLLCPGFGQAGTVDLKQGMGNVERGYYYITSAPTIVNGIVVLGGWILDNQHVGEPSGVIRGFDAITGAFVWAWDIDRPNSNAMPEPGKTFSLGTPNSWGPMSGDEALGAGLCPYWQQHTRLFGGQAVSRQRTLFKLGCGSGLAYRQASLELPDRPPRFVGL